MRLASNEKKSDKEPVTKISSSYGKPEISNKSKEKSKTSIPKRILFSIIPDRGDSKAEICRKVIMDVSIIAFIAVGSSLLGEIMSERIQADVVDKKVAALYEEDATHNADTANTLPVLTDDADALSEIPTGDRKPEQGGYNLVIDEPVIQSSFKSLYEVNNDVVGWIRIGDADNPVINYPVVQSKDNDYYLYHNFYKEEVKRGAIFADYRNSFLKTALSGNTILYGHNMWNGDTMFAKLSRYYDGGVSKGESSDYLSFYKEHPTITFNTIYKDYEWKVFACVLFNTESDKGEVYPYNNILDFASADKFNKFIIDIMDRSVLWTDVDLAYGDSILTLSTCYYPYGKSNVDTRVAVFARKVRVGESTEVDVSKAERNPDPLKFEYQYQVEGGSWGGSIWDRSHLLR